VDQIELNGKPFALAGGQSLQALVEALDVLGEPLALAVNREVVPRQYWHKHQLLAGDKVDIVRAIGGG
jgi:sulfur carrier protein